MTTTRRLAADVVGYSRLTQLDEAGTLAALKARRKQILQPLVAKHHGRVVRLAGDGVLVSVMARGRDGGESLPARGRASTAPG